MNRLTIPVFVLFLLASTATGGPMVVTYQGSLRTPTGAPVRDGTYKMQFTLFDRETTGIASWTEVEDVKVLGGLFSVQLGDGTPFGMLFLTNLDYWFEVAVDLDGSGTFAPDEIYGPRQRLASAAYAINADHLGGLAPTDVALSGHNHDTRYVELSGDHMTGTLTVPALRYASPRTHYYSVPGDVFRPRTNVNFVAGEGEGGAYITGAGENGMVASFHLPHGATIMGIRVYVYDNVAENLNIAVYRLQLWSGGNLTIAGLDSAGISGYGSVETSFVGGPVVDNTRYGYAILAYTSGWSVNLRIMGAVIEYTLAEAP